MVNFMQDQFIVNCWVISKKLSGGGEEFVQKVNARNCQCTINSAAITK